MAGKSQGADRYKSLRKPLIPLLHNTIKLALKEREISDQLRETIVSVIPKEEKDKLECVNYRPISVLNQD